MKSYKYDVKNFSGKHGAVPYIVYIVGIAVFFFELALYSAENGLNFPLQSLPESVYIKALENLSIYFTE